MADQKPPKPPPDKLVPVTICLSPRTYDNFCREAGEKQQSLSQYLRERLAKN